MKILLSLLLALLLFDKTEAAEDMEAGVRVATDNAGEKLDKDAKSKLDSKNLNSASVANFSNFYEIEDSTGTIVARLNLTQGPFFVELVKIKNESGVISYVANEKGRQPHQYGNYSFTSKRPEVTAIKSGEGKNGTKLEITFTFNEEEVNSSKSQDFIVKTAELKMIVEWGVPVRMDYWNITNITLTMSADLNSTSVSWTKLDLSPKPSYNTPTAASISPACTAGFGICAPLGLCWSCTDQVLRPYNITKVYKEVKDNWAVFWHLPGMVLEPELGPTVNVTMEKFRFSANWDCEPLIPLSIWVGLLVSLLLVSILAWAIKMLADLQTPNKWDDPKKPGIHVPQAE